MKKTLKEAASSFNYLSGIKNPSVLKEAVTIDGKEVDTGTIELEGTEMIQRYGIDDALPDIFASAAQFTDGTELNDEQLSKLTDNYPETIEQIAIQMMEEGSCGYSQSATGESLKTPGGTKGVDAQSRTNRMKTGELEEIDPKAPQKHKVQTKTASVDKSLWRNTREA